MLRALLLYLSGAAWAQKFMVKFKLARRVALRFVAGETQEAALDVVRTLNAKGITATIDVLGESITEAEQARTMTQSYLGLIDAIHANELQGWISLKLTALGLDIDEELCRENMRTILGHARNCGVVVTIDMEDHLYTDRTLAMFHKLHDEDGFKNVRTVVQAYLYRSVEDIEKLAAEGAGIRLCKGAYREPAEFAYPKKSQVDEAYVNLATALLDAARVGLGYPGIATHDETMIEAAKIHAALKDVPTDHYEFQMLYGVRSALQEQLVAEGYRMRVYVPFGTQWYPYFMRRLAERPANIWFFVSNFFRR